MIDVREHILINFDMLILTLVIKDEMMKITVFTSNQARHISLIEDLASVSDQVYAVQEVTTVHPGEVEDFYKKSDISQKYFRNVIEAERKVFGLPRPLPKNVSSMAIKMGDLNKIEINHLDPFLHSDLYIVFGSSFIKGDLIDFLVSKKAINIHVGIAPYYRGNSCNFWALYDRRPELVGATIHFLSKGLDSGDILFHTVPDADHVDGFELGMLAVRSAHQGLKQEIANGLDLNIQGIKQECEKEIKYTRKADFTDEIAKEYLENRISPKEIELCIKNRNDGLLLLP